MGRNASEVVAAELAKTPTAERPRFLREMMAHVAAGIVVLEGDAEAAEAIYRLADAVVARKPKAAA